MKVTMRPVGALPKSIMHRKATAYCQVSTQPEIQRYNLDQSGGVQSRFRSVEPSRVALIRATFYFSSPC